jgi:hypothetical protein
MLRPSVGFMALFALTLSACDNGAAGQANAPALEATPSASAEDGGVIAEPADASGSNAAATTPLPAYSEIYPGAVAEQPAVAADGAAGPGGMVTFVAEAAPDAVVDFYRQRAEAAGLASMTALSQGETRAYGAAGDNGAAVQVVAAPDGEGRTSVQLTWSAGR